MNQPGPGPRTMRRFELLQGKFVGLIVLAVLVWWGQDFVASFAAREMMTTTTLRTVAERDDARVVRAFREAQKTLRVTAQLQTEPKADIQVRDSVLTIKAPTKDEALEARQAMVPAMQMLFARESKEPLYDIGNAPFAVPVPNDEMQMVRRICGTLAVGLALFALGMLVVQWRQSNLPGGALAGILATAATLVIYVASSDNGATFWGLVIFVGLPGALLGLVVHLTLRVNRAQSWTEGRARITATSIKAERHRFSEDTTKVRNLAVVNYEFNANGTLVKSDRISIGIQPADRADETMKRYPVGAEVPVFYDPANPQDCVLERSPPVSLGCLWFGAVVFMLAGVGVVLWFRTGFSPAAWLSQRLPNMRHPAIVFGTGLPGLFCLAAGIWNRLHPRCTLPWVQTPGNIVSNNVESYSESRSNGGSRSTYYKAVIEFRYWLDGKEYHGIKGSTDLVTVSVSGDRKRAEAEAALYPKGKSVDVYYDPQNPTRASLTAVPGMTINGTYSLIVGTILVGVAVFVLLKT